MVKAIVVTAISFKALPVIILMFIATAVMMNSGAKVQISEEKLLF